MRVRKVIQLMVIFTMLLSYLGPVKQALAAEASLQVNLKEPVTKDQVVELSFDVISAQTDAEVEKIELIKNGTAEELKLEPVSNESTESGEVIVKTYNYLDPILPETTTNTYSIRVKAGSEVVESTPVLWNAELPAEPTLEIEKQQPATATKQTIEAETAEVIHFPDPNLEQAVRDHLGLESGTDITTDNMLNLYGLGVDDKGITNLSGLEFATNLYELSITGNPVVSLDPILSLPNLSGLYLSRTSVTSLEGIEGLTSLTQLYIDGTQITDLSPLLNILNPIYVYAYDIPVDFNTNTEAIKIVGQLEEKGFTIEFEKTSESIDLYTIVSDTAIRLDWDHDDYWFENISYRVYVDDVLQAQDVKGLSYTITDLKPETEYIVKVEAIKDGTPTGDQVSRFVKTIEVPGGEKAIFEDVNLEESVKHELAVSGRDLYKSDLAKLQYLASYTNTISSLVGLESAVNLEWIDLSDQSVTDLEPLEGLEKLYWINLENNPLTDISVLTTLPKLNTLYLANTDIDDISSLLDMPSLYYVDIRGTNIDYETDENVKTIISELVSRGIQVDYKNLGYISLSYRISEKEINLSWDYEGERIPESYRVFVDGELHGETQVNEYIIENLTPETEYNIKIAAVRNGELTGEYNEMYLVTKATPEGDVVVFEDYDLEEAIKEFLNVDDRPLYESDMKEVYSLYLDDRNISSLVGIEKAVNMWSLSLGNNDVKDLAPLKDLTNLHSLSITNNPIENIEPLIGLVNLESLYMGDIGISSLTGVEKLVNLTTLYAQNNQIQDLTSLKELSSLRWLDLSNNPVETIGALSSLQNIEGLYISDTEISDISPLLDLPMLQWLVMENINIDFNSDQVALDVLTVLFKNGVEVTFLNAWINYNITEVTENSFSLTWEYVSEEEGLEPNLYKLFIDGQEVTDFIGNEYTFTNLEPDTGYEIQVVAFKDELTLVNNHYTWVTTQKTPEGDIVTFEDARLEEIVRGQLEVYNRDLYESDFERLYFLYASEEGIESLAGLEYAINLQTAYLGGNSISDLTPLQNLSNLTDLDLSYNPIEDISSLESITTLQSLNLSGSGISDLTPLLSLTNLYWVGVMDVAIDYDTDEAAKAVIAELKANGVEVDYKKLGYIYIYPRASDVAINLNWDFENYNWYEDNAPDSYKIYLNGDEVAEVTDTNYIIENLQPETEYTIRIAGIKNGNFTEEENTVYVTTTAPPSGDTVLFEDANLEAAIRSELWVYDRALRESDMERLYYLYLNYEDISSLKGLEYAVNLEDLSVYGNNISDVSPLKDLKNLLYLELSYNRISDISPLSGLPLYYLGLDFNQITDVSSLASLTTLSWLSLGNNRISNLEGLNTLTGLQSLGLESNLVKDLTPLKGLYNLEYLYLASNPASEIEVLRELRDLQYVNLYNMPLDLTEGSSAYNVIEDLRTSGVEVYTSEGYSEELYLDFSNITDHSVDVSWYGNFDPNEVSSAQLTVYSYGDSVIDDVYDDVYSDIYDDVYDDVYSNVYDDVYGGNIIEAEYAVDFEDYSYTIEGLEAGTDYRISMDVILNDSEEINAWDYVMTKWSADDLVENVSFKVVDQNGNIVPDMEVSIEGTDEHNQNVFLYGYTDKNGLFQSWYESGTNLALPQGNYSVYVNGNGKYEADIYDVQITKDGVYPLEIQVNEIQVQNTSAMITVKDSSGNPVTSLEYISLYSSSISSISDYELGNYYNWDLTSGTGVYLIDNVSIADDYVLNIEAKDFKTYSELNVEINADAQLEITLEKGAEVKASVKTTDGKELTGATYSIYGDSSYTYGSVEAAGLIHAVGLNEEDLTVNISMPGYLSYTGNILASDFVDGVAQLSDITLEPEQFIEGYVYKSKVDEPVKHASISVYGDDDQSYWGRTDANGYFKIRNVQPGTYSLKAEAYNLPTAKVENVKAGETVQVFLSQNTTGAFAGEGNSLTTSKNSAVPGETIEYRLNYSNNAETVVKNVELSFVLPESAELIADSLLLSSKNADTSAFTTEKKITLSEVAAKASGTISFKVKVKDNAEDNLVSSASIISGEEVVSLNSTVTLTFVTLNGPEVTADAKVKVYGSAKPGSTVKVYDGSVLLVETTVPVNSRWWYADVQLPVKTGENSTHQLIAKVTTEGVTAKSPSITVNYIPSVPKLTDLNITAGWNDNVSLNPYTGVATMAIVEYTQIKVKAKFDQDIEKAALHFLGESHSFIKRSDGSYEATIPSTWSSYGEQLMELTFEKNGQEISMPIVEVIVLIDPSGYVFEGSMQNRLPGVTAVVEEQSADGTWTPWNAAKFGQVNPQVTDEEGRYGWDVIQGAWRVLFSKDGYTKYTSRTVYVPPAETQLNVPLVRSSDPVVEQTSILDGAENVSTDGTFEVKFDRLMNETSVNENVKVLDENGNVVQGTLKGIEHYFGYNEVEGKPGFFEEDQSKVLSQNYTWKAASTLADGNYQLVISKDAADYSGKNLLEGKTISFTVGQEDNEAPGKPVVNEVTDKSTSVTGKVEAGAKVEVKAGATLLGSATASEDGNFTVTIAAQAANTELTVTATDAAGNVSEAMKVTVKDATAPGKPVVDEVTDKSTSVTGKVEAGAKVEVKAGSTLLGSATASQDGSFTVTVAAQAANTELTVTATDAAGNVSEAVKVMVKDATAPGKPVVNEVTDKSTSVTGKAEAGAKVEVKAGATVLGNATASEDGSFTVTIAVQAENTELTVTATDAAGNVSEAAKVTVKDATAPGKPVVNEVTDKSTSVTGKAEAGAKVEVKAGSTLLGSATASEDGNFTVTIAAQAANTELTVTATDAAGNVSEAVKVTVKAETKPEQPKVGWVKDGTKWYFYGQDGKKVVGWKYVSGVWYYFEADGTMKSGVWFKEGRAWYYFDGSGAMKSNSWLKSGSTWYYFNGSGAMVSASWVKSGNTWYFFDGTGSMKSNSWLKSGASWYYFDGSGAMKTGWLQSGGKWYFFNPGGNMVTGWKQVGTKWYYFYSNGSMAYNTVIGGSKLGKDGAWIK